MLRDASNQQNSLNLCNVCSLQMVTQLLKAMLLVQEKHRRCTIENARGTWRSVNNCLGPRYGGGGYDGECSICMAERTRRKGLYRIKNVSFAYIAVRNLRVDNGMDSLE